MLSKEATGLLAERFPRVFCLGQGDAGCSILPSPPRRPLIWRQQTSPAIDALDKTFVYDWAGRPAAADQRSLTGRTAYQAQCGSLSLVPSSQVTLSGQ